MEVVQLFGWNNIFQKGRVIVFLVDEMYIRMGHYEAWVWVAMETIHSLLGICLSRQRNIVVAEFFLGSIVKIYGRYVVYTDEGVWYPDACRSLGLQHRIHSLYGKSLIERVNQYLKTGLKDLMITIPAGGRDASCYTSGDG